MTHTCTPPTDRGTLRSWKCPQCGTAYVWSKRMIGREVREGWDRMTYQSPRARITGSDEQFDRWFNRAFILAGVWTVVSFLVVAAIVVWIVLRVTS